MQSCPILRVVVPKQMLKPASRGIRYRFKRKKNSFSSSTLSPPCLPPLKANISLSFTPHQHPHNKNNNSQKEEVDDLLLRAVAMRGRMEAFCQQGSVMEFSEQLSLCCAAAFDAPLVLTFVHDELSDQLAAVVPAGDSSWARALAPDGLDQDAKIAVSRSDSQEAFHSRPHRRQVPCEIFRVSGSQGFLAENFRSTQGARWIQYPLDDAPIPKVVKNAAPKLIATPCVAPLPPKGDAPVLSHDVSSDSLFSELLHKVLQPWADAPDEVVPPVNASASDNKSLAFVGGAYERSNSEPGAQDHKMVVNPRCMDSGVIDVLYGDFAAAVAPTSPSPQQIQELDVAADIPSPFRFATFGDKCLSSLEYFQNLMAPASNPECQGRLITRRHKIRFLKRHKVEPPKGKVAHILVKTLFAVKELTRRVPIGVVVVVVTDGRGKEERERDCVFLKHIAHQTQGQLRHVLQMENLSREQEKRNFLLRFYREIVKNNNDSERSLLRVVQLAGDSARARTALVFVADYASRTFICRTTKTGQFHHFSWETPALKCCFNTRTVVSASTITSTQDTVMADLDRLLPFHVTRSILCAPLINAEGIVLAILVLLNCRAQQQELLSCSTGAVLPMCPLEMSEIVPFSREDEDRLSTLAAEVSVAAAAVLSRFCMRMVLQALPQPSILSTALISDDLSPSTQRRSFNERLVIQSCENSRSVSVGNLFAEPLPYKRGRRLSFMPRGRRRSNSVLVVRQKRETLGTLEATDPIKERNSSSAGSASPMALIPMSPYKISENFDHQLGDAKKEKDIPREAFVLNSTAEPFMSEDEGFVSSSGSERNPLRGWSGTYLWDSPTKSPKRNSANTDARPGGLRELRVPRQSRASNSRRLIAGRSKNPWRIRLRSGGGNASVGAQGQDPLATKWRLEEAGRRRRIKIHLAVRNLEASVHPVPLKKAAEGWNVAWWFYGMKDLSAFFLDSLASVRLATTPNQMRRLSLFFRVIAGCYRRHNPYHNFYHAIQVYHVVWLLLRKYRLADYLRTPEVYGVLIGALCHDVDHPGVNNDFFSNLEHPMALTYNDQSILENHHCALTFKLFQARPDLDIRDSVAGGDRRTFRQALIRAVLATDMARHNDQTFQLSKRVFQHETYSPFSVANADDRWLIVETLPHAADLSNALTPLFKQWASLVTAEFNLQADREATLGLPVTPFMNCRSERARVDCQIGFVEFLVLPLWRTLASLRPELREVVQRGEANARYWHARMEQLNADGEAADASSDFVFDMDQFRLRHPRTLVQPTDILRLVECRGVQLPTLL